MTLSAYIIGSIFLCFHTNQ